MSFAADWLRRARARQRARAESYSGIDRSTSVRFGDARSLPEIVAGIPPRHGKSEAARSMLQRDFDETVEMALEGLARLRRGEGC